MAYTSAPEFDESCVVRERKHASRWVLPLIMFLVGSVGAGVSFTAERATSAELLAILAPAAVVVAVLLEISAIEWGGKPRRVQVASGQLALDGVPKPALARAASAYVITLHRPYVLFRDRFGRRLGEIQCHDADECHRLLEALGLGWRTRVVWFFCPNPVRSSVIRVLALCAAATVICFVAVVAELYPTLEALLAGGVIAAFVLLIRSRIGVGLDGFRYGWPVPSGFVAWDSVALMSVKETWIEVTRKNAPPLRIRATVDGKGRDDLHVAAVHGVMVRALKAHGSAEPCELDSVLSHGTRTFDEWIAQLKSIASKSPTYRAAGVDRDALWTALTRAGSPPDVRFAAAFVLLRSAQPGDEDRVVAFTVALADTRLAKDIRTLVAESRRV